MKTIIDLLKATDATVCFGYIQLGWQDGWGDCDSAWTVTRWPAVGPVTLVARTLDEAEAVAAFIKAVEEDEEEAWKH